MYTPPFFYTTCTIILAISVVGVFRYSAVIARTNDSIIDLRIQMEQMHIAIAPIETNTDTSVAEVVEIQEEIDETVDIVAEEEIGIPDIVDEIDTEPRASLPDSVHLTVPFTSQAPEKNWDQPWQDACEEAAILMLDAYYKGYNISPLFARDELLKIVQWEQTKGWGGSIDIVDVRSVAAWYMQISEQKFNIIQYPEIDEIKTQLANGNPVLAVADGTVLPNPHFSGDGPAYHALVIIGYDDTTGEFITNDPGTQHGKNFRYAYRDLVNSLRDWNGGDVVNGMPVALVYSN